LFENSRSLSSLCNEPEMGAHLLRRKGLVESEANTALVLLLLRFGMVFMLKSGLFLLFFGCVIRSPVCAEYAAMNKQIEVTKR